MPESESQSACPGPRKIPPEPGDLKQLEEWAKVLADSLLTLLKLVKAEFALTLVEIPRIIALSLALVPFLLLAWISFAVLVAWFAYSWTGSPGTGIFAFFLLQAIPCVVLVLKISRVEDSLFFPATKRQLKKFAEFLETK